MRALVACLLIGMPAHAGNVHAWGSRDFASTITLQPTEAPGAVAEVEFVNRTVHADEDVTFALELDGLQVEVFASVGRGLSPDHMTITPPEGFIAVPSEISVEEAGVGVVLIYEWTGM